MEELLSEDSVNRAISDWLTSQGATSVKCLRGKAHGIDVEAILHGRLVLVESKGETPNDPNKTHEFDGAKLDSHIARQVFKALELRQKHPNARVFIANPHNSKIVNRFEKVSEVLTKLDIEAHWVLENLSVISTKESPYFHSTSNSGSYVAELNERAKNQEIDNTFEFKPNSSGNLLLLGGHKFGIVLAILFPHTNITQSMIRKCSTISGSYPEASEMHKYLTGQGGSKRIEDWVSKHGGKEQVLSEGSRIIESNEALTAKIHAEITSQLSSSFF